MVKVVPTGPEAGLAVVGTFTVPCMSVGWIEQWYGKVPANENVKVNVPLCGSEPEAHSPMPVYPDPSATPSLVLVWLIVATFVHLTPSPRFTFTDLGVKLKFWMVTSLVAARAVPCTSRT